MTLVSRALEVRKYVDLDYGQKRLLAHILIFGKMFNYYFHTEDHDETLSDESIAFAHDIKFSNSDHTPFVIELDVHSTGIAFFKLNKGLCVFIVIAGERRLISQKLQCL